MASNHLRTYDDDVDVSYRATGLLGPRFATITPRAGCFTCFNDTVCVFINVAKRGASLGNAARAAGDSTARTASQPYAKTQKHLYIRYKGGKKRSCACVLSGGEKEVICFILKSINSAQVILQQQEL